MSSKELQILSPQSIMVAWAEAYLEKSSSFNIIDCHTLLRIAEFENTIHQIKADSDIGCYLTGFTGGVRYAPVMRYSKIHLLVPQRRLSSFLKVAECKQVDSGTNVQIHIVTSDGLLYYARIIENQQVAPPVQVYLGCMKLKGRREEMAEGILLKEIARLK